MKKKLVAFAVTAAMVVTSAVPVFADTVGGWGQKDQPTNVIQVTDELTTEAVAVEELTSEGKTFETIVDLNKALGTAGSHFNLEFVDENGEKIADKVTLAIYQSGSQPYVSVGSTALATAGIVTLQWTVTNKDVTVAVVQHGYSDKPLNQKLTATLPAGAVGLASLTVDAEANYPVTMYEVYPEYVEDITVVTDYGDKEKEAVATQPVEGVELTIKDMTLTGGTVIAHDEITKYANVQWYADGEPVGALNDLAYEPAPTDRGKVITVKVVGSKDSGVFGETLWGENTDPIAVATRYAGANRYETAMDAADAMKPDAGYDAFVVATGEDYADALSASAFADSVDAPILLVNQYYEDTVAQYIAENAASYKTTVYIVGGEGVVSEDFAKQVDLKYNVKRLAGDDRYATNLAVLEQMNVTNWMVVVSGQDYADALTAAAIAQPIMIVGDTLTVDQIEFLGTKADDKDYIIVGGIGAVSLDVEDELALFDKDTVARYWGSNRYETAYAVAETNLVNKNAIVLASGDDFADGLVGGVVALDKTGVVLLVNDNNTTFAERYADENPSADLYVVGGEGVVSNTIVQNVWEAKIA